MFFFHVLHLVLNARLGSPAFQNFVLGLSQKWWWLNENLSQETISLATTLHCRCKDRGPRAHWLWRNEVPFGHFSLMDFLPNPLDIVWKRIILSPSGIRAKLPVQGYTRPLQPLHLNKNRNYCSIPPSSKHMKLLRHQLPIHYKP